MIHWDSNYDLIQEENTCNLCIFGPWRSLHLKLPLFAKVAAIFNHSRPAESSCFLLPLPFAHQSTNTTKCKYFLAETADHITYCLIFFNDCSFSPKNVWTVVPHGDGHSTIIYPFSTTTRISNWLQKSASGVSLLFSLQTLALFPGRLRHVDTLHYWRNPIPPQLLQPETSRPESLQTLSMFVEMSNKLN